MRLRSSALFSLALLSAVSTRAQIWGADEVYQAGVGGRALGMGGAQVAETGDATALYYNPAGLALLEAPQVEAMQANLFDGASFEHLAYAYSSGAKPAGWGVQVLRLNSGSVPGADQYNNPTGSYEYSELALSGGYGEHGLFLPRLSLGGSLNMLTRTMPGSADKFLSADFGAQYGPILADQVMLGAVLQNPVSLVSGDTSDKLPVHVRAGASWRPVHGLDVTGEIDESQNLRVGVEYAFSAAALRAGYSPDGISFGAGINFRRSFSFDVAMLETSGLGMSQRISLTYRFESRKKPRRMNMLGDTYLRNGQAELQSRDYVEGARDIDLALGLDPLIGDGQWKHRMERLDGLIKAMELDSNPQEQQMLKQAGPAGDLAFHAINALLEGQMSDAMVYAHVAAGSGGGDSVFARLLQKMSEVTRQSVVREDILASAAFVSSRARRAIESTYAQRYDAAVRACKEALLIAPDDAESWMRLGSAQFAAGRREEALKAYRKALELQPANDRLRAFVKAKFGDEQ